MQRAEHRCPLGKKLDPIVPVGYRQFFGAETPEQADHPQESVSLPGPVFLVHDLKLLIINRIFLN